MNDAPLDPRFLDLFPAYLRGLGDDVTAVVEATTALSGDALRSVVAGIHYVVQSADRSEPGMDDLIFLDDAFVLRVAARMAAAQSSSPPEPLARLAEEAQDVRGFLQEDYGRLEGVVRARNGGGSRGRGVDDVLADEYVLSVFAREAYEWAKAYAPPPFVRDARTLVKLRAFLRAKLA